MSTDTTKHGFWQRAGRVICWVLFGIVIWFVGRALIEAGREVDWSTLHPEPRWISAGLALYVVSLALVDLVVRHLYRHLGVKLHGPQGFILYMVPTLGRYLPGKVLSLAGHVLIARRYGIEFSVSAAAIALLTVVGLATATLVGFIFLLIQPPGIVDEQWLRWVLIAGVVLVTISLLPGVWFRFLNAALRIFNRQPLSATPGYSVLLGSILLMSVHVVFLIAGYAAMTAGAIGTSMNDLPILIGAICIANTLGFIAVFAPAGIGVREGVLLILLTPTLGAGAAALFAVTLRLIQIVADSAASAVGLLLLRLDERSGVKQAT